jgi:hypothetical protein
VRLAHSLTHGERMKNLLPPPPSSSSSPLHTHTQTFDVVGATVGELLFFPYESNSKPKGTEAAKRQNELCRKKVSQRRWEVGPRSSFSKFNTRVRTHTHKRDREVLLPGSPFSRRRRESPRMWDFLNEEATSQYTRHSF